MQALLTSLTKGETQETSFSILTQSLKYSEERLKEQKNLLKMVFDCMQEGVIVIDTKQNFVITNHKARTTLPIDPTTKDYQDWAAQVEAFYPDQKTVLPPEELPALKALRGEMVHNHLGYYKSRSTHQGIFLSANANPLTNKDGQLIGAVIVFNDVSERIKAQQQIASSFATLKGIIEGTLDLVVAIDTSYTILTVNSPAQENFRMSTGKMIDKDDNIMDVLAQVPAVVKKCKRFLGKGFA